MHFLSQIPLQDNMEPDDFKEKTVAFLSWLSAVGVQVSPKMELVEMRLDDRRCRGIGKTSISSCCTSLLPTAHLLLDYIDSRNQVTPCTSPLITSQPLLIFHIVASADFEEDEIVFSIPRHVILNIQTVLPNTNPTLSKDLLALPSWLVCYAPFSIERQSR